MKALWPSRTVERRVDHHVLVVLGASAAGAALQAVDRTRVEVLRLRERAREEDRTLADAMVRCASLDIAVDDDERVEAVTRVLAVAAALRPELIDVLGVVDVPDGYRGFGEVPPETLRDHLALGSRRVSLSDVLCPPPAEA